MSEEVLSPAPEESAEAVSQPEGNELSAQEGTVEEDHTSTPSAEDSPETDYKTLYEQEKANYANSTREAQRLYQQNQQYQQLVANYQRTNNK